MSFLLFFCIALSLCWLLAAGCFLSDVVANKNVEFSMKVMAFITLLVAAVWAILHYNLITP